LPLREASSPELKGALSTSWSVKLCAGSSRAAEGSNARNKAEKMRRDMKVLGEGNHNAVKRWIAQI
jgi:hypothetical protein